MLGSISEQQYCRNRKSFTFQTEKNARRECFSKYADMSFFASLLARFKIFYEKQDSFTKLTMSNMSSVRIIIKFINYRQTANVSLDWV